MPIINIAVRKKIAKNVDETEYICGNSDFLIDFDFDAEWDAYETKTARFIYGNAYQDIVFQGNQCKVPVMSNTNTILCGVFAGDLHTTTPALIKAQKSILCGNGIPAAPSEDVYAQIMELIQGLGDPDPEEIAKAVAEYMAQNPITESDPTVPEWAKAEKKPEYTAKEVGAVGAEELPEAINTALAQAKASGEFEGAPGKDGKDGQDGYTPIKGVDYFDGVDGKNGQDGYTPVKGKDYFDGKDGQDGEDGKDATSPVISVSTITGGHRITIKDVNGTKTVDVMDGSDGQDGSNGKDGNGIKSAVLNADYTLTLTFDNGTSYTTPSIRGASGSDGKDGSNGKDGQDGYTPVKGVDYFDGKDGQDGHDGNDGVSATHSWNGTILTVTSASGTSSADLKGEKGDDGYTPVKGKDYFDGSDGKDGHTPVKGTDYWTATDKAAMVSDVLAALPTWTGGSY